MSFIQLYLKPKIIQTAGIVPILNSKKIVSSPSVIIVLILVPVSLKALYYYSASNKSSALFLQLLDVLVIVFVVMLPYYHCYNCYCTGDVNNKDGNNNCIK